MNILNKVMQSSVSVKYPNEFALLSSMGPSIGMFSNHGLEIRPSRRHSTSLEDWFPLKMGDLRLRENLAEGWVNDNISLI